MLQQREIVRLQHRERFGLGQKRAAFLPGFRENPAYRFLVRLEMTLLGARAREPLRVAEHRGE